MTKQVKITKDGQVGQCLPESVAMWERHGWTSEDDGSSTESSPVPPSETAADETEPETEGTD